MTARDLAPWIWVLDSPQDTLTPDFLRGLPKSVRWTALLSALFCYALAKTLMASPPHASPSETPAGLLLILNFSSQFLIVFSSLFIMYLTALRVGKEPASVGDWTSLAAVTLLPLHLCLPLALLCRPLGTGGVVLYALCEMTLWLVVLRRAERGVQNLLAWPPWAALLLILSPLLWGGFILMFSVAMLAAGVGLVLLGILV